MHVVRQRRLVSFAAVVAAFTFRAACPTPIAAVA
jgi:hypothetical protein